MRKERNGGILEANWKLSQTQSERGTTWKCMRSQKCMLLLMPSMPQSTFFIVTSTVQVNGASFRSYAMFSWFSKMYSTYALWKISCFTASCQYCVPFLSGQLRTEDFVGFSFGKKNKTNQQGWPQKQSRTPTHTCTPAEEIVVRTNETFVMTKFPQRDLPWVCACSVEFVSVSICTSICMFTQPSFICWFEITCCSETTRANLLLSNDWGHHWGHYAM